MILGGLERSALAPFMVPFFSVGDWLIVAGVSLAVQGGVGALRWLRRWVDRS